MYTISDIISDMERCCLANNMIETCFSYRIIYFVNENGKGTKFYVDTSYAGLREALENIIRKNLSTTNTVVLAAITARKVGKPFLCLVEHIHLVWTDIFNKYVEKKRKVI